MIGKVTFNKSKRGHAIPALGNGNSRDIWLYLESIGWNLKVFPQILFDLYNQGNFPGLVKGGAFIPTRHFINSVVQRAWIQMLGPVILAVWLGSQSLQKIYKMGIGILLKRVVVRIKIMYIKYSRKFWTPGQHGLIARESSSCAAKGHGFNS